MAGSITRWEPFAELGELRGRLDRMFEEWGGERAWSPAIDVERRANALVLHADVPGIKPDEVGIEVENDILTISGSHEETSEDKQREYLRRERRYGSFSRSMALPAGVDPKKIKATTKDGVVEVVVPLAKAEKKGAVKITPKAA